MKPVACEEEVEGSDEAALVQPPDHDDQAAVVSNCTGWSILIGQELIVFGIQWTSPVRASTAARRMQPVPQPTSARTRRPAASIPFLLMVHSRSSLSSRVGRSCPWTTVDDA